MATTKKKYSPKPKTDVENTGAMDEFLDTVVGETIKEEDVIPKKPKAKPKPAVEDKPKVSVSENGSNNENGDNNKVHGSEDGTGITADIEINKPTLMESVYGMSTLELLGRSCLANNEFPASQDNEKLASDQIRVTFTTSVIDTNGNVLHWNISNKVLSLPSDSKLLSDIQDNDKINEIFKKFLDDYIYKKLTDKSTAAEEVKPVDITPEVVAPKLVFPTRLVDKW